MSSSASSASQVKELVIPIQIGGPGRPTSPKPKTPKPRFLPFEFDLSSMQLKMPSADEMLAKVEDQMAEMKQQSVEQMKLLSSQAAAAAGASQSQQKQVEELEAQEFFVPLKNIGKVQKNALAEATAMAKTKVI